MEESVKIPPSSSQESSSNGKTAALLTGPPFQMKELPLSTVPQGNCYPDPPLTLDVSYCSKTSGSPAGDFTVHVEEVSGGLSIFFPELDFQTSVSRKSSHTGPIS